MPQHKLETISMRQMYGNPTGKGSANVASRYAIRNSMNQMFIKNLNNFRRAFMAIPYVAQNGTVYFWVKVPSRNYKDNKVVYDAVFEIAPGDAPLQFRPCKFFTNSPSFVYTYAYVFAQEGLIIDWLMRRLPALSLSRPPIKRNPVESRGYELILYQALSYLIVGNCLTDKYINKHAIEFNAMRQVEITTKVADTQRLIQMYQYAKYDKAKTHRKPITKAESLRRSKEKAEFANEQRRNKPSVPKKIFAKTSRPNITAKKARKKLSH